MPSAQHEPVICCIFKQVTTPPVLLPEGETYENCQSVDYEEMIAGIEVGGNELARMCVMVSTSAKLN